LFNRRFSHVMGAAALTDKGEGMRMNIAIGDIMFQLVNILIIIFFIAVLVSVVRYVSKNERNNKQLQEKLDRIIELLEKERSRK
jgi:energy-converting hydrogenase Eha subunit H